MTAEEDVRAANLEFYRAFRERDVEAMGRLWAEVAPIACIHPGMDAQIGRSAVMESWRGIFSHPQAPRIQCTRVRVRALGEAAVVTCLEGAEGSSPTLIATNIFVREAGRWRMVHHHAGPISAGQVPRHVRTTPDPNDLN